MTQKLLDINAGAGTLKHAADAGAYLLLKRIAGLMAAGPIDPDRQQLLDEVKGFENSLKGTVLDTADDDKTAVLKKADRKKEDLKLDAFRADIVGKEKKRNKSADPLGPDKEIQNKPSPKSAFAALKDDGLDLNKNKDVSIINLKYLLVKEREISQLLNRKKDKDRTKENLSNGQDTRETIPVTQGRQPYSPTDMGPGKIEKKESERYGFETWFKKRIHQFNARAINAKPIEDKMGGQAPIPDGKDNMFKHNKKYPGKMNLAQTLPMSLDTILRQIIEPQVGQEALETAKIGKTPSGNLGRPVKRKIKKPVSRKIAAVPFNPSPPLDSFDPFSKGGELGERVDQTLNGSHRQRAEAFVTTTGRATQPNLSSPISQDPMPQNQMPGQQAELAAELPSTLERNGPTDTRTTQAAGIPEELKTAVQWMAEEEVENKLVEMLRRQAKLRGVDLS